MSEPTPFIVHCGVCNHEWTAAYLPMRIETFAKVAAAAACPFGCDDKVYSGRAIKPDPIPDLASVVVPTPPNQYEKGK